jgi:hypothetical protein
MAEDGVRVTNRDIYDAVMALRGKVDTLLVLDAQKSETIKDQENRLRAIEHRQWPLPTLAALIALASLAVSFFANVVS